MKKTKREKKRLLIISVTIISLVTYIASFVASDWKEILENKKKIEELGVKYNELLSDEEKLVSQVTRLQDEEYIAQYAKEKYMYSSDGEFIIRLDKRN